MTTPAPFPGVIEGFYGRPWDSNARTAVIEFLGSRGFSFYCYAPKADRSLRREWRRDFTPDQRAALTRIAGCCRRARILFGVGLSPFEIWRDAEDGAIAALDRKIDELNEIGVDILALLYDDMRGDFPGLPDKQAAIANVVAQRSTARRLILCPTYYSSDPLLERVFGPAPPQYVEKLGRLLPREIEIFWTGPLVCSDRFDAAHLDEIAARLGRKPFIWSNAIATDGAKGSRFLPLAPAPLSHDLANHAAGIAVNGMNQGFLTQVALSVMTGVDAEAAPYKVRKLIARDAATFTKAGLDGLDPVHRERLVADYAAEARSPWAAEILAWLKGDYAFDPACLTD